MDGRMSKKALCFAVTFCQGHSWAAYCLRSKTSWRNSPESDKGRVCDHCEGLLDLRDMFNSFGYAGRDLKWRRTWVLKPKDALYRNIKQQNKHLLKTIFDGKFTVLLDQTCSTMIKHFTRWRLCCSLLLKQMIFFVVYIPLRIQSQNTLQVGRF